MSHHGVKLASTFDDDREKGDRGGGGYSTHSPWKLKASKKKKGLNAQEPPAEEDKLTGGRQIDFLGATKVRSFRNSIPSPRDLFDKTDHLHLITCVASSGHPRVYQPKKASTTGWHPRDAHALSRWRFPS